MINLEIVLSPTEDSDMEQSICDAISRLCGEELHTLQSHLHHEFRLTTLLGPTTAEVATHLPAVLHRLTNAGQSRVGRLLSGESVSMTVCGSTTSIERNSVLCNVLTLLIPHLSVEVLADLLSAWALTDGKEGIQRALCEYYLQASRTVSSCDNLGNGPQVWNVACTDRREERAEQSLLFGDDAPVAKSTDPPPTIIACLVTDEQRAHHFLRTMFCMLTVNRRTFSWRVRRHQTDGVLTKKFGLSTPDLDACTPLDGILDVSFAVWYLSTQDEEDIADAFERARMGVMAGPSSVQDEQQGVAPTKAMFVRVVQRRPCDILIAIAPNCAGCDSVLDLHSGGGCGTRELITWLVPAHALQLLEMLVCDKVNRPIGDLGVEYEHSHIRVRDPNHQVVGIGCRAGRLCSRLETFGGSCSRRLQPASEDQEIDRQHEDHQADHTPN